MRAPRLAVLPLALVLVGVSTSGAGAAPTKPASTPVATTVGAVFVPAPESTCSDVTVLQATSPNGSYAMPTAGVITSWQFQGGAQLPSTAGLRIGRPSGAGYDVVVAPAPVAAGPGGLFRQDVRIAVRAGDLLGLYVGPGDAPDCARQVDGYGVVGAGGQPVGLFASEAQSRVQLAVSATFEPDADADGYGDVTQDRCPTEPARQGECQFPDTSVRPARVGKVRPGTTTRAVSVRFASTKPGSRFECALDTRKFTPCTSPLRVRLAPGRHKLSVRAVAPDGAADSTPATTKVRVRKR